MSKRPIEVGHRVEVTAADCAGQIGIVREIYRHRGEGTVFNIDIEGHRERLSFLYSEIKSLEPRRRFTS